MNSGGVAYVETGGIEPIEALVYSASNNKPLTGKADIKIRIRRHEDDLYYDWNDNTFKAYGSVTQLLEALQEVSATQSPGVYRLNTLGPQGHPKGFDTAKITNLLTTSNTLEITYLQDGGSDAAGLPLGFELKIGNFLDTILRIVGLQKENYFIDNTVYNAAGLLTSARIRLFKTKTAVLAATNGGSGEGEFESFTFTSTEVAGNIKLADVVRSVKD